MGKKILYGFLVNSAIGAFSLATDPKNAHQAAVTLAAPENHDGAPDQTRWAQGNRTDREVCSASV